MSNKSIEALSLALNNLNSTAKKLILASNNEYSSQTKIPVIELNADFDVNGVLSLIGTTKYVGIVADEKLSPTSIAELINILTSNNKVTVIRISNNPISCKVFYPSPKIGTKHIFGNYEYSYGQRNLCDGLWKTVRGQKGWGVKVIDKTRVNYESPLMEIQDKPITNMSYMFFESSATILNLIDWNTSTVTDMNGMFDGCKATSIDLSGFDTSNVKNMSYMFHDSKFASLDLSSFNTSKVTNMSLMFYGCSATNIDLSNFNTSKVKVDD